MSEFTVDKYTTLQIADRGQYGFQLLEGWINRDGVFKPNFCKREFGAKDAKTEKTVPVSVKFGDKEQAIQIARWIIKELSDGYNGKEADDDAPPF